MFKLSRDELNRRRMAKPIQSTKEMFEALGFDDLVEPGVKFELSTRFHEVFQRYARITNPEDGGEKVYTYDAHLLVESVSCMQAELYSAVATSREEVLRDKALLKEGVLKLSEAEEKHVKKLAGELEVCKGKLQAVQQLYMECGTQIDKLEALVAALSVKPSHGAKYPSASDLGGGSVRDEDYTALAARAEVSIRYPASLKQTRSYLTLRQDSLSEETGKVIPGNSRVSPETSNQGEDATPRHDANQTFKQSAPFKGLGGRTPAGAKTPWAMPDDSQSVRCKSDDIKPSKASPDRSIGPWSTGDHQGSLRPS